MRTLPHRLIALLLMLPPLTAAAQGVAGYKPPAKPDVTWLTGECALVELDANDPRLKTLPGWPVPVGNEGRFLFGPTPGYDVKLANGLLLQPRAEDGSAADPIAIPKPERRRFSFVYGAGAAVEVPVEFFQARGKWSYRFPVLLELRAGGVSLCFQDADGDGWFDDLDTDLVAAGEAKDAARLKFEKFAGEVAVGGKRYLVAASPRWGGAWPVSNGVRKDYVRHVAEVNATRRFAGLPACGLAEELIPLCEAHSSYCGKWGLTHFEDRGKAGYTPEGDWAGQHSNVGTDADAVENIRQVLRTLWHRNMYYVPALERVGVGFGGGVVSSDVLTHSDPNSRKLIFAPIRRALDVPLDGSAENPEPYPVAPRPGPFVTVLLPYGTQATFKEGSVVPRGGEAASFDVSDPASPPGKARGRFPDNDSCIVLVMHQPLKADAIYDVRVVAVAGGAEKAYAWAFRTGAAAPARRR